MRSKTLLPFLPLPEEKNHELLTHLTVTKKVKIYINRHVSHSIALRRSRNFYTHAL